MHGELLKARCTQTGSIQKWSQDIDQSALCSCCQQPSLRPHIVWFGEMPLAMDTIYNALETCDLFLSIGTSGQVYPAAGFVEIAKLAGAYTVEFNLEDTDCSEVFDQHILGPAGTTLPAYLKTLLT